MPSLRAREFFPEKTGAHGLRDLVSYDEHPRWQPSLCFQQCRSGSEEGLVLVSVHFAHAH